jgi:DNA-binding NarL/FixJ family response regulator
MPGLDTKDTVMQTRHNATHMSPVRDQQRQMHGWLADVEREIREALDQAQLSSHRCNQALAALAQLRACIESDESAALGDSSRRLPGRALAHAGTGMSTRDDSPLLAFLRTPPDMPDAHLTSREIEVLTCIAGGNSNKEIARGLCLSIRTVERHINNIYRKIDAQNKADATAWALRHNLA